MLECLARSKQYVLAIIVVVVTIIISNSSNGL